MIIFLAAIPSRGKNQEVIWKKIMRAYLSKLGCTRSFTEKKSEKEFRDRVKDDLPIASTNFRMVLVHFSK
jgi:hypothetical protein